MDERLSITDVIARFNDACDQNISVAVPIDGSCSAEFCNESAIAQTLIGLRFCNTHYSAFYSDAPVLLKGGSLRVSGLRHINPVDVEDLLP